MADTLYDLALHLTTGIGNINIKQLISYRGSAKAVLETPKGKLAKIPGIGTVTAEAIQRSNHLKEAQRELEKAEKQGIEILSYSHPRYPENLKKIPDAPAIIFVKGNINFEKRKSISIVGTRKATGYGKDVTRKIIEGLIEHQPIIISGLAYGIDIEAHRIALEYGLDTVAVMASGIDKIYPASHFHVANNIACQGALVTEYKLGTIPDAPRFPARNRIIAGMADCTLVVEAAKRGGALITAEIANSYNKDVFAIPGNANNKFSEGCNHLIKSNKAHLVTSADDIAYIMNWDINEKTNGKVKGSLSNSKATIDIEKCNEDEKKIIKLLSDKTDGLAIDLLVLQSHYSPSIVASILLKLEFDGIVKAFPGKIYKLAI